MAVRTFLLTANGSDASKNIFHLAKELLASPPEAQDQVFALHVWNANDQSKLPPQTRKDAVRTQIEDAFFSLKLWYEGVHRPKKLHCEALLVESNDVPAAVLETAGKVNASLVGVGSDDMNRRGKVGSLAMAIITQTRLSTILYRSFLTTVPHPLKVMFALDGSITSEQSLAGTRRYLSPGVHSITVVTLRDSLTDAEYAAMESRVAEALPSAKLQVIPRKPDVSVSAHLCDLAKEMETDVLVMGSTGLAVSKDGKKHTLGSVAQYCVANASCHVLVVKGVL